MRRMITSSEISLSLDARELTKNKILVDINYTKTLIKFIYLKNFSFSHCDLTVIFDKKSIICVTSPLVNINHFTPIQSINRHNHKHT